MAKNPDLRTALACAKQVMTDNVTYTVTYTDAQMITCSNLIVEMYDLEYAGIHEIIDKVLADDLDAGQAVKAITSLKKMYDSAGNGES